MNRTRPLHNFDLPELRWGHQRFLRCINLPSTSPSSPAADSGGTSGGIDVIHENLILDLRNAAESMKLSMTSSPAAKSPMVTESPVAGESPEEVRPWNLRTRRAACKAPEEKAKTEPERREREERGRREREERGRKEKVRFSVGLTRGEIDEDFKAMIGVRAPRRPKKRSKTVQRELDQVFPGLWLTEITPETYKVDEVAE